MSISIHCRELGIDCDFSSEGETENTVVESIMHHLQAEHAEDWYEIEEFYQAVCSLVRGKAA